MHQIIRKAFTLIELLVVIAIIGILSGLIIVTMNGVTQSANVAKAQIFSNSLRNTLMLNLVSEWKFDELATAVDGTVIQDSWSGGNNGTLDINYSATDTSNKLKSGSSCVSGKCIQLDGVDDYVDFGDNSSINITDAITLSFWVNDSGLSGYNRWLINKGSGNGAGGETDLGIYRIYSQGVYTARVRTSIASYVTTANVGEGTWNFLTLTFDSNNNTLKFYKNGLSSPAVTTSGKLINNAYSLLIGDFSVASSYLPLKGSIDELRIYNVAVPTSQIEEQYYAGLNSLFLRGGITKEEYLSRLNNYASNN